MCLRFQRRLRCKILQVIAGHVHILSNHPLQSCSLCFDVFFHGGFPVTPPMRILWQSDGETRSLVPTTDIKLGKRLVGLRQYWYVFAKGEYHENIVHLVGGLERFFSHSVGNVIIPTDFHSIIFQRGRYTTNHSSIFIQGTLWNFKSPLRW